MVDRYHRLGLRDEDFAASDATISKYQAGNLDRLADYLLALPSEKDNRFSMRYIMLDLAHNYPDTRPKPMPECNAVGCALGHAPSAGIPYESDDFWHTMGQRELGIEVDVSDGVRIHGLLWNYCFKGAWHEYDNTPGGAGKRIKEFLIMAEKHGRITE